MSDPSLNVDQPAYAARISLNQAGQELRNALGELTGDAPDERAQFAIRAIEQAIHHTEQALQETEAIGADAEFETRTLAQQPAPDSLALQSEPEIEEPLDLGASEASREVAVDLDEQTAMMNDVSEEPLVMDRVPDEEASLESDQSLETFDAELERAGEDKAPLEAEAERFVGVAAINADGDELGVVQELLVDLDGALQGVVLDVAAFLGIPERQVVVDWEAITISGDDRVVIDMARDDVEQLPTAERPRR